MKISLNGHDYKYAVEQIMLTMFPGERPEYASCSEPEELFVESGLSVGRVYATSVTRLHYKGKRFTGIARAKTELLEEKLSRDRALQRIIKLSFYKAASEATGYRPPWGALTGIRPGKMVSAMLGSGYSEKAARRVMEREYDVSPGRARLCLDTAKAGLEVKRGLAPRDICLYVGIPFCPTRCAYCSFVSNSVEKSTQLVEPFLDALHSELDAVSLIVKDLSLRVISVYIGGGTPTTLTASQLSSLMEKLALAFDLSHIREYTVEAGRPDTLTAEKIRVMSELGATRVSVNPQTMRDSVLRTIGRSHTARDIDQSVALVRRAGGLSINMDIIAGLPSDTESGFRDTLDRVLGFAPENLTVHTLSLKKGSRITLEDTALPGPAQVGGMLEYASSRLPVSGYSPYYLYRQKYISGGFENVGWSVPGFPSLYNICIMEELAGILSLGGGGVTKLVAPETGKIQRIFNAKYPYEYIIGIDKIIEAKEAVKDFYENEVFSSVI